MSMHSACQSDGHVSKRKIVGLVKSDKLL